MSRPSLRSAGETGFVFSDDGGLVSFRLPPPEMDLIRSFFDRRADFERVSDKTEWQPRAARHNAVTPGRCSLGPFQADR